MYTVYTQNAVHTDSLIHISLVTLSFTLPPLIKLVPTVQTHQDSLLVNGDPD
jgi:hypothetical protein